MEEETVVIQTKLGQLRGHTRQSVLTGKTYYAFQGIPYAKPPIGELRFKAPQPCGGWEGVRDACEDSNDPKQPILIPKPGQDPNQISEGDEDCLYLNICINEISKQNSSRKPVLFNIHGGGFAGGSGTFKFSYPDYFMNGDVIFVSINYRCGAFGFLSLDNEEVPGNAGLKDQTLALQWVHDNIDSFGGDPNNVTVFGLSAGGASVDFHLLSPLSRGLFHKAIAMSGFSSNPWALQLNPRAVATKLAKALGCTSDNTDEMLQFLRSVSADDIVAAAIKISKDKEFLKNISLIFSPTVEVAGSEPFLPDSPLNILKNGAFNKVPVILGASVKEGSVLILFGGLSEEVFKTYNDQPEVLVPYFLELKPGSVEESEATKAIWDFYFKGKPISWDNVNDYLLCQSDILFNCGMEYTRAALVQQSTFPVYTYLFTNHTKCMMCANLTHSLSPEHASAITTSETCHGADVTFLIAPSASMKFPDLTSELKEAIKKHMKAFTTFASVGDPNCKELGVTWRKDSNSNPCFMDIGTTWEMKEGVPLPERTGFWKNLETKYSPA